jgi:hypothetical protein
MRPCAVSYTLRATQTACRRIRQSRDVLYRATPSSMTFYGALWILAAMVWDRAVLDGGVPDNYKFGAQRDSTQKGGTR